MQPSDARAVKDRVTTRVRRSSDALAAVVSLAVLVAYVGAIHELPAGSGEVTDDVASALRSLPGWFVVALSVMALLASFALALCALALLVRREPRDLLTAGVGAVIAAAAMLMASLIWDSEHGELDRVVLHGTNASTLVYDCAFVAFLTAGAVTRRVHWTRWCVACVALLLVGDVASRTLTPLALPIVLVGGLGIAWGVRFGLETSASRPSAEAIAAVIRGAGLEVAALSAEPSARSPRFLGTLADGTPFEARVADRDTAGFGALRRAWVALRLRPAVSGHPALSSRSRLERLALAAFLADRAGTLAPRVLAMSELDDGTLVLAMTCPSGRRLGEHEPRKTVGRLFSALRALHDAGVAHRDLRAEHLVVDDDEAGFASLDSAQPAATELLRRADVAQLLTTVARLAGTGAALEALREDYRPADENAIAAVLQPMALAPWGWTSMRAARGCVAELREDLVGPEAAVSVPQSFERFRWRTVAMAVALVLAGYVLVGQLSKVDLAGALEHANPWWCLVALVGSALTYLAAAENLAAFVPRRLSVLRGFAVQLSTAFVGVAMPPTVGHVAVNSRYLHRQGVDEGSIAAAVALSQIVNVVTTVLLLLVIGLLTGSGAARIHVAPSGPVLIALGAVAGAIALLMLIPPIRSIVARTVWPRLRMVWPRLVQALSNPVRLGLGGGANVLLTAGYALAFVAAIRAVGGHPAILPVTAVYLAGNTVGSVAPTPGGVGAVEAVLAAGLSALGMPVHQAIPAVLIFRLATLWLPIPAGWVCYALLTRRNVI